MINKENRPVPTTIKLHQKSRVLEIAFSDGFSFHYPCEYLRVFSTSAETKTAKQPVNGKAGVNITKIEPQGAYAIRLFFTDGHSTGIYSWETLYKLAKSYDKNWAEYLQELENIGLSRGEVKSVKSLVERSINLIYFMHLANIAGQDKETVTIPATVVSVEDLLSWLRERGKKWSETFNIRQVQVTINKQFAESFTLIDQGDEIALVPRAR